MKKNTFAMPSRRSFIKSAAKMGLSSAALNGGLASANLLWARGALAQEGPAPKRFITIHVSNGAHPDTWHAKGIGGDFTLPQGSAPFGAEGIRDYCIFMDGITGAGGHGPYHQCLSNEKSTSLDVYAASKISADTPFKSIHLASHSSGGLSRINGNGIPFETNPINTYDRLFPEPLGEGEKDWASIRRRGIFGANLRMLSDFRKELNATQKERLDLHATSVEAVAERIQRAASAGSSAACTKPFWEGDVADAKLLEPEVRSGASTVLRSQLSMDLIALAFKCDLTRVASFSFGDSGAETVMPDGYTWHDYQHGYQNEISNPRGRAWFSEQMVYLMTLLKETPDVDGRSVLDNTLIYLTSDMGNGSSHDNDRTPIILAGGLVQGGKAMDFGGMQWNPLFDTLSSALGLDLEDPDYPKFGNGAGPMAGVIA